MVYFFTTLIKHEIRKVYSKCFVFRGVFRQKHSRMRNAKSVYSRAKNIQEKVFIKMLIFLLGIGIVQKMFEEI